MQKPKTKSRTARKRPAAALEDSAMPAELPVGLVERVPVDLPGGEPIDAAHVDEYVERVDGDASEPVGGDAVDGDGVEAEAHRAATLLIIAPV